MQISICVKYCGGCNPIIDRAKLVQEIKKLVSPEFILSDGQTERTMGHRHSRLRLFDSLCK